MSINFNQIVKLLLCFRVIIKLIFLYFKFLYNLFGKCINCLKSKSNIKFLAKNTLKLMYINNLCLVIDILPR